MTKEELAAIKERAERAMPGPWIVDSTKIFSFNAFQIARPTDNVLWANGVVEANAEFIAHSRVDVPLLIQEVERLQERFNAMSLIADDHAIARINYKEERDSLRELLDECEDALKDFVPSLEEDCGHSPEWKYAMEILNKLHERKSNE
jgi:hypothetical protein